MSTLPRRRVIKDSVSHFGVWCTLDCGHTIMVPRKTAPATMHCWLCVQPAHMQYLTDTQHEEPQDMRTPTGRKPSEPNVQAVPGTPTVALEMQQAGIKRNAFSFDKTYGQILTQELNGFRHLRERICAEMMEQQEAIMREALRRVGVALADVSPHRLHAECGPSHTVLRLDGAALVRIDTVWQSIDYGSNYPFEDAHIKAGCVIRATYYKEQA